MTGFVPTSTEAHLAAQYYQLKEIKDDAVYSESTNQKEGVRVTPRRKAGEPTRNQKRSNRQKNEGILITRELLSQYLGMPLPEVAKILGICTTSLKMTCRKLGVDRWPMPPGRPRKPQPCETSPAPPLPGDQFPTQCLSSRVCPLPASFHVISHHQASTRAMVCPSLVVSPCQPLLVRKDVAQNLEQGLYRRPVYEHEDLDGLRDSAWRMDVSAFIEDGQ
eukprot:48969-Rhodomonas_salina.1